MRWLDGWMALPTRWTWVWMNSGSWWWTGRPGVLWFMGSQRVRHDWVAELNWTEPLKMHLQPNIWGRTFGNWQNYSKITFLQQYQILTKWLKTFRKWRLCGNIFNCQIFKEFQSTKFLQNKEYCLLPLEEERKVIFKKQVFI